MKPTFQHNSILPFILVAPIVGITLIFFVWPSMWAIYEAFFLADPFGLARQFVWFDNFKFVLSNPNYFNSVKVTALFTFTTVASALSLALLLAVMVDAIIKGSFLFKTALIWPYAVAPAVSGVLWMFLLDPPSGFLARQLIYLGIDWNPALNGGQALTIVTLAAVAIQFYIFSGGSSGYPKISARSSVSRRREFCTAILDHRIPSARPDYLLSGSCKYNICAL